MKKPHFVLWIIILLTVVSAFIDLPSEVHLKFSLGKFSFDKTISRPGLDLKLGRFTFVRDLEIKRGIDLAGGTHLVFEATMDNIPQADRDSAISATKDNIERRINLFGVSEPVVQTSKLKDNYRLIVEIPGIKDINQAVELIGQTAQLSFNELTGNALENTKATDFKPTDLTGADLIRSQVQFDPNTGNPVVGLEFNTEGTKKFSDITTRNVGKPVAIFLDNFLITAPMVKEPITSGKAVISGEFSIEEAKKLSIQLNAGALPVPIKLIEQRNIGASLGNDSVQKSIRAGVIGLLMVVLFMATYYGKLGILADVSLFIYALLTLALYKLVPVTLTLPGIAGFLLSIGMAVDSNILIFERMKEELRIGKSRDIAMELGFGRAWDSIRDANVCTLITSFILFNPFNWTFLNDSGMVRGFALTLGLGVLLSLFTGIVVTRTVLRTFARKEISSR
jgi:preprotein translocase subunit SecD